MSHATMRLRGAFAVAALTLSLTGGALASTLEPSGLNLGDTSFDDGFGSVDPAWAYNQYFQVEHYSSITDNYGNKSPGYEGTSITAIASVNQLLYVSPLKVFGGALGFDTVLPVVDLSARFADTSPSTLKANGFGLGDVTFGPFIQFAPVMGDGHPVFTQRFEFDFIAPTGAYDLHADINQSSGYYSLNPYWAFTVIPMPGLELSSRLYYLYNFTNDQPAASGPAFAIPSSYKAGQAISDNFAASFEVYKGLELGVNGYIFQQLTNDKVDGIKQADSKTLDLSVGPGATYTLDQQNFFFANAYLPAIEKNTLDGVNFVLRWTHVF